MPEQRKVPPFLEKILELDRNLTKKFVSFLLNLVPMRSLQQHCRFLEISCHGVVWIVSWLALAWLIDNPELYEVEINVLFGLLLDIVAVAILKALTRRRRPVATDDPFCIGPDKFSFPSGHASRSFFVASFFTWLHPLPVIFWPPIAAWAFSVALSRLLMYRHHILDVVVGCLLGCFEAAAMHQLWVGRNTSLAIIQWIMDDKNIEGQTGI